MTDADIHPSRAILIQIIGDNDLLQIVQKHRVDYGFDSDIREAFVLLERRIRDSSGLGIDAFGKDLVDKAFDPKSGILQPFSVVSGERHGLHQFLVGLFQFYRNPIAHRTVDFAARHPVHVISLIDLALTLVSDAANIVLDVGSHIGRHEGQVVRRRDFRMDIDDDGDLEIISMVQLSPVLEGGKLVSHLSPIILKKKDGRFQRILAESIRGESMHGASGVELRPLTGGQRPDIVLHWGWGETQVAIVILRWENNQYTIARRHSAQGTDEPYSGRPSELMFNWHDRQLLSFVDIDGDGQQEITHDLNFDREDMIKLGYESILTSTEQHITVCRVHRWNETDQRFVQVEERPVVSSYGLR